MTAQRSGAQSELERLRDEVATLERQLVELEAWANRAVAEAQAKTYWLERWHIDLNALMRRRSADRARATARAVRSAFRATRRLKRRLLR